MLKQINSKKGVSIMIGYVMLISFAVVLSAIVYTSLKTYVPAEVVNCPNDVSIFMQNYSCISSGECSTGEVTPGGVICSNYNNEEGCIEEGCEWIFEENQLNITIKNNGKFSIGGYFIHATTLADQELATEDLSSYFNSERLSGGVIVKNAVIPTMESDNLQSANLIEPGGEFQNSFEGIEEAIYSIEIIPIRFQEEDSKMQFVSCGASSILEEVSC